MKRGPKIKKFCIHGHEIAIVGRDKSGKCKECKKIYSKPRYKNDPSFRERVIKQGTKRQQKIRMEKITMANEAKSKPCMDCGISYPPYVMDFDHRNPSKKKFGIAEFLRKNEIGKKAIKKLLKEIKKSCCAGPKRQASSSRI